ncbi:hypothetical protein [Colwellia hornerae]|uniref:Uncharacterized protein n=1 Tax=Colwellia hornerae TaxID=89402 RepID=A0A5C6Q6K8_9GAMM|nr:hypothetical protein [Colwellia hornerae]TWX49172.1 hypothetical protein ESZ28_16010 [Colwellia hornerae]TWX55599.1 hypothetical protein ESZ26_15975 [Colwellia hornerae]TWX64615.1 hypothetical protein ESZ27_14030 [Colwellia hornerae]
MFKKIVSVAFTCSFLFSCQQAAEDVTKRDAAKVEEITASEVSIMPKKNSSAKAESEQISFTATIKYMNLEGGFFGLVSKEGKHWLPLNLEKEFQKDGAVIKVTGKAVMGLITIQQWGTPFSITDIELITAASKAPENKNLQ